MEKIDLDQKLEYKGYWYLPSASDDRVAGVLTYHPNEKIVLELMGCFGEYSWSILTKKKEEPIILGRSADGKDIALINNIQSFKINSGVDFPLVRYTCNFMIIGKHVKSLDEKHHYWATARIPELSLWCQPGALTTTMVFGKNRSVDHVNLSFSTEFRSRKNVVSHVKVDENTGIKVMKGVRYNGDHLAPEIEQFSYLEVRKKEKTSIKELLTDIFMFEQFLSLATLSIVKSSSITLYDRNTYQQIDKTRFYRGIHVIHAFSERKNLQIPELKSFRFLFDYSTIEKIIRRF